MSFVRLYKILADSPVGFQTFNQAGSNLDEMRTQMFVGHGENELGYGQSLVDYSRLGRHDLKEVARTVGNAVLTTTAFLAPDVGIGWTGVGIPSAFRIAAGDIYMPVIGLAQWFVDGVTLVGTGTYLPPQFRSFYAGSANGSFSGLSVRTYALNAGTFVATDVAFSFALYGNV